MARIFVKNYPAIQNGFIEVNDNEAIRISNLCDEHKQSKKYNPNNTITIDSYKIEIGKISGFKFGSGDIKNEFEEKYKEYFSELNRLRRQTPEEKTKSTFGEFKFFYYGVYQKKCTDSEFEKYRSKIIEKVNEFFSKNENRYRIHPDLDIWCEILGIEMSVKLNKFVYRMFQRILYSDEQDVKNFSKYENDRYIFNEKEEEVANIIKVDSNQINKFEDHQEEDDDLPF